MKNIAIIAGGNSSEYEVSMKSGKNIYDEVDENGTVLSKVGEQMGLKNTVLKR